MARVANLRRTPFEQAFETITAFAAARKLSRAMVAYSFLRHDLITDGIWRQVVDRLRQEWLVLRKGREREGESADTGGPSYYVVKRHRLGNALLDIVRRSLGEGVITYTRAAQVLGVKPRNVDPLIHGTLLESNR